MKHSEEEILAAYDEAVRLFGHDVPAARSLFLGELRKEKPVLFTREKLLEAAAVTAERILVHGIFGLYGTQLVSEESLHSQAATMGHSSTMAILIGKVKAQEAYEVGATYRDADGRLCRYTEGGFLQYVISGNSFNFEPKRPLEKI